MIVAFPAMHVVVGNSTCVVKSRVGKMDVIDKADFRSIEVC